MSTLELSSPAGTWQTLAELWRWPRVAILPNIQLCLWSLLGAFLIVFTWCCMKSLHTRVLWDQELCGIRIRGSARVSLYPSSSTAPPQPHLPQVAPASRAGWQDQSCSVGTSDQGPAPPPPAAVKVGAIAYPGHAHHPSPVGRARQQVSKFHKWSEGEGLSHRKWVLQANYPLALWFFKL